MPKKRVGDVTVSELCSMAEFPNGLYLLFDENDELWYVGKATSRSFIERVPSHFDQREEAWFNTLPKKIMTFSKIVLYRDAHSLGLSLRLVLIGVQSKDTALKLERMLRAYMSPHLNTERRLKYTGEEPLAAYGA
jgi:excinuclease UvrABC nuclease subunit